MPKSGNFSPAFLGSLTPATTWDYDFKDYKSTADLIFAWQRSWSYEFVEVYKDDFSERKLVSLLDSAYMDDNSFDAFVMFLKIHKNVNFSEDDRKKILHEGFTEYNQRLINRIKNEIYIPMFYNSDDTYYRRKY